jgi:hypothetical protein
MTTDQILEEYRHHPRPVRLMLDFNFNLAGNLHPTRQNEFFGNELPAKVWRESRIHARLSKLMLSSLGLDDQFFFDTSYPFWSLISLPSKRLTRLAHHAGAIAVGSKIRSTLARSQVLDWKSQLGEDAFQFAMKSSQLLPAIKMPAVTPGIVAAELMGYGLIFSCVADAPDPVQQRMILKIPKEAEKFITEKRNAAHIIHSVITTLEPEWHSLFKNLRN